MHVEICRCFLDVASAFAVLDDKLEIIGLVYDIVADQLYRDRVCEVNDLVVAQVLAHSHTAQMDPVEAEHVFKIDQALLRDIHQQRYLGKKLPGFDIEGTEPSYKLCRGRNDRVCIVVLEELFDLLFVGVYPEEEAVA